MQEERKRSRRGKRATAEEKLFRKMGKQGGRQRQEKSKLFRKKRDKIEGEESNIG